MSVIDAEDSLGTVALPECEDQGDHLPESVHLLETFKKNPIDRSLSQDKCADQEGPSPAFFNQISDLKNVTKRFNTTVGLLAFLEVEVSSNISNVSLQIILLQKHISSQNVFSYKGTLF